MSINDQLEQLRRGVEQILPEGGLEQKLGLNAKTGEPLSVKLGCDPTRPDLHLGHSVVLRKLRQFQDLGHRAVLIVGDFTARIGDPSGRSKTRPTLSEGEITENAATYVEQASKILDTNPDKLDIVRNSAWLDPISFADVVRLAGKTTVARMLEREDFKSRYTSGEPISLHEFLYPLAQAQDSIHLEADVELGGTDQTFNLLMGRAVMESAGLEPQVCMTLPILEGTDGTQKMSKSLDNYIGLTESPEEMYGKTLSIPDELIYRWVELVTDIPAEELPKWKKYAANDPRNAKHDLALHLVTMYHTEDAAKEARAQFEKTVVSGELPDDMETVALGESEVGLLDAMRSANLTSSNGEGRRLVQQGAVSIDGEKVDDPTLTVSLADGPRVLKVGKRRFARISE